jgi:tetratricopeptide (TPR) repeat protein
LVLTDDYAPIESLVCPVVQADAISFLCVEYFDEAKELFQQGELDACLRKYREIIDIAPTMSVQAYNEMGMILFERRKWMEAAEAFENCLKYIAQEKLITNTGNIHYNLAEALNSGGKIKRAYEEFQRAIEEYRRELREDAATKLQEYLQSLQAKQSQKND